MRDNQRKILFIIAAILCLHVISGFGFPLEHQANSLEYTETGNQVR